MGSCLSTDGIQEGPRSPSSASSRKFRKGSKKRQGSYRSSDSKKLDQLHKIPGRLFGNGSSDVVSLFTQQGKKGINQDAMIAWENFGSRKDTIFCGVFDGHGPFGHMVARKVRDSLPLKLTAHWDLNHANDIDSEDCSPAFEDMKTTDSVDEEVNCPEIFMTLKEAYLKAFKIMDRELKAHPDIDCFCSGTTAVTLIKQGQDLVIGNIGDSRAVLGTRDENNCLAAIQLTVDLKPNLPSEKERIKRCKGRVFALRDEPEVARVWLPNNDSPGLAMARAFGDFCLKDFGLISVPEVSYRHLTERDEFIVLATDGVWDVLSNKEVVGVIESAPARCSAARCLVESAVKAWKCKYPTSKVDDCAVVCLFLTPDSAECMESYALGEEAEESLETTEICDDNHQSSVPFSFDRSGTLRSATENLIKPPNGTATKVTRTSSNKRHSGTSGTAEGEQWSALEGVARVNTLLALPRFVPDAKQ